MATGLSAFKTERTMNNRHRDEKFRAYVEGDINQQTLRIVCEGLPENKVFYDDFHQRPNPLTGQMYRPTANEVMNSATNHFAKAIFAQNEAVRIVKEKAEAEALALAKIKAEAEAKARAELAAKIEAEKETETEISVTPAALGWAEAADAKKEAMKDRMTKARAAKGKK